MNNAARRIRISEREANQFSLIVIDDNARRTHDQGIAFNCSTPEQVFQYAQRILPNRVLRGAAWEYRSTDGIYATLDPAKLGWR